MTNLACAELDALAVWSPCAPGLWPTGSFAGHGASARVDLSCWPAEILDAGTCARDGACRCSGVAITRAAQRSLGASSMFAEVILRFSRARNRPGAPVLIRAPWVEPGRVPTCEVRGPGLRQTHDPALRAAAGAGAGHGVPPRVNPAIARIPALCSSDKGNMNRQTVSYERTGAAHPAPSPDAAEPGHGLRCSHDGGYFSNGREVGRSSMYARATTTRDTPSEARGKPSQHAIKWRPRAPTSRQKAVGVINRKRGGSLKSLARGVLARNPSRPNDAFEVAVVWPVHVRYDPRVHRSRPPRASAAISAMFRRGRRMRSRPDVQPGWAP